jgi:pimeloyl-ACP methyl ester carboxylesterase
VPFVDVGELRLFFTDEGTGSPPMLFLHGYTCDSHDWSWLNSGPVVVVGHSMGALVASVLAVEHPEMVHALVAVDPAYLVEEERVEGIPALLEGALEHDPVPVVQALLGASDTPASSPALRTCRLRRIAGMPEHVLRQTLVNMSSGSEVSTMRSAGERYLTRRRCPVLSFYTDPSRVATETALFTDPRSQSISWAGSGHWLHQERPAELNALVDAWLDTLA